MMKRQIGSAEAKVTGKKRVTRRKRFLAEMEKVVSWQRLLSAIEPHYPKDTRGRPPIGLADEGLEDALYYSIALRAFAGINLAVGNVPDATTPLRSRRLLRIHELTRKTSKPGRGGRTRWAAIPAGVRARPSDPAAGVLGGH